MRIISPSCFGNTQSISRLMGSIAAIMVMVLMGFAIDLAQADQTKTINSNASNWASLELNISELEHCVTTDQPLPLQVSANQDFYLWAYIQDAKGQDAKGQATWVLPTAQQPGNKFVAGHAHWLAQQGLDINPSQPGRYELVIIATTEPFAIDPALWQTHSVASPSIDQAFAQHGIKLEAAPSPQAQPQHAVQRLDFKVFDPAVQAPSPPPEPEPEQQNAPVVMRSSTFEPDAPVAFVQLDRSEYRVADMSRLIYGATEAGFVQIMLRYQDQSIEPLFSQQVEANKIYLKEAKVIKPLGWQTLIITYTRENPLELMQPRGLQFDQSKPKNIALFPFQVVQ